MNQRNVCMGNRILYNKSIERNQEIHMKKLREIRSNFRAKSPFSYEINKRKKEQLQETKHTEIERENRILLEKITNIMQNKQMTMSMKRVMSPKSLNQTVRKKKLVQIAEENQFLLRRLQEKRSNYDISQYEQQWANTKSFINTITGQSKTPKQSSYYGSNPNQFDTVTPTNNQSFSHSRNNSLNPLKRKSVKLNSNQLDGNNNLYGQQNSSFSNQNVNTSLNSSLNSNFRISQPRRGESAQVSKRSISSNYNQKKEKIRLYKQVKVIGNIHFDVEIYMFDGKMMIVADEIEGDETKIIEIPSEEALNFLREECDNNLDSLVLRLRHANNQLFLIGTKKSREKAQQNSASKSNQDTDPIQNVTDSVSSQRNQQNVEQANFDQSKISQDQIKQSSSSLKQNSVSQQKQRSSKSNISQQNINGESSLNQQNSNFSINNKNKQEVIRRGSQQLQNGSYYRNTNEDIHENFDEDNQESVNDQLQYAQNMKSVKEEENDYFKENSAHKSRGQTSQRQNNLPQNSRNSQRNEFEDNSPDKYVFEDELEENQQNQQQYQNEEDEEEEEEEEDAELEGDYNSQDQDIQNNNNNNNNYHSKNNQHIKNNFSFQEEEIDI